MFAGDVVQWFSDYLKERYIDRGLTKLNEESDAWPPLKITSFTTPLFIQLKQIQTKTVSKKVIAKRMVGNIRSIHKVSESVVLKSIEEIFKPIGSKSILIEGHPGIGKTILVKEICIRWAKGKLLNSNQLVLLLLLRDPKVQQISNEQQMIEYFLTPSVTASKAKLIQQHLEEKDGADVTLIIDGLDELGNITLNQDSFITRLVNKQILNKARLVITSCPLVSACLHEKVDKHVEILGFGKNGKEHFVNETLKNSLKKLQLQRHFQLNPSIDEVCYLPLILKITVLLCMHEDLSNSIAKMYTKFVMYTICRHLKRKGMMKPDETVTSMEGFPKPVCDTLKLLGQVAYTGVSKNIKVFEEQDLPDHEMWKSNPTCFGLLQPIKCYSSQNIGAPVIIFNFYHEHLQKYFAARHVMSLPENQAYDLIRKYLFIKHDHLDSDSSDEDSSDEITISNQKDTDDDVDDADGDVDGDDDDDDDDGDKEKHEDTNNVEDDNTITFKLDDDDDDDGVTMNIRDFVNILATLATDDSDFSDDVDSDLNTHLSDMWLFLFGLTNGCFTPLQCYLSTFSSCDDNDIDERYYFYS